LRRDRLTTSETAAALAAAHAPSPALASPEVLALRTLPGFADVSDHGALYSRDAGGWAAPR
jgi:hypothetical protein